MNNTMTYAGYTATLGFDPRDNIFIGKVLGTADHISFHGATVAELTSDFHQAIDFYLADRAATGRAPEQAASGELTLRLAPDVHAAATMAAHAAGKTLELWASEALKTASSG